MTKILLGLCTLALLGNVFVLNATRLDIKSLKKDIESNRFTANSGNFVHTSQAVEQDAIVKQLEEMTHKLDNVIKTENTQVSAETTSKNNVSQKNKTESIKLENQIDNDHFPAAIEETFAVGFVDKTGWEQINKELKDMDKEENKKFWMAMFEKLENDEVVQINLE